MHSWIPDRQSLAPPSSSTQVCLWLVDSWYHEAQAWEILYASLSFLAFSGRPSVCPCSYSSILSIIFRSLNCLQTRLTPACLSLASSCSRLCVQGGLSPSVNKTKNPAEKHISMKIELTGLVVCCVKSEWMDTKINQVYSENLPCLLAHFWADSFCSSFLLCVHIFYTLPNIIHVFICERLFDLIHFHSFGRHLSKLTCI